MNDDLRQLREATVIAAQFFRGELLRDTSGWPVEYLKEASVEQVLSADSDWKVGYAPDTRTSLVDHLAAENFSYSTMERAGLVNRTGEADVVDRFRDQLVLMARDTQLRPAGFVAIGSDGTIDIPGQAGVLHQPSNVLIGIEEQLDLLRGGATPVVVDHPIDAIAVSNISRQLDGRWAGIPVCGDAMSTAQVRMLRKFTLGDTALIIASGDEHRRKLTSSYLIDLARYYPKVRALSLPEAPSLIAAGEDGPEYLATVMSTTRPVMTYRIGATADVVHDPQPPDLGQDL
ncbi:hypothetical protein ACFV9C_43235 [Kribbella sp. NPDC059898]|uniref:hypothetical protein n=1 Tax=Kribbella sp. NPDC059898 TaxID=3346995 RepID=UPI00365D18A8